VSYESVEWVVSNSKGSIPLRHVMTFHSMAQAFSLDDEEDQIRCREGFRKLIERAGFFERLNGCAQVWPGQGARPSYPALENRTNRCNLAED
jgi:hypothetical protein